MIVFKDVFLRDRAALFWIIIFPSLMYLTFSSVFSGFEKRVEIKVAFDMPKVFLPVFEKNFKVIEVKGEKKIRELVLSGKADCGVYYEGGKVKVYYGPWVESKMGKEIIGSILENFGRPEKPIKDIRFIEKGKKQSAKDFYFPSGIVMAILGVGFFGGINVEEYFRRKGIKKMLRSLPPSNMPLDLQMFLSHALACLISTGVLIAIAIAIKAEINLIHAAFGILYGIMAFIPLGMGLGRIFKKASVLVANLFYFTLLFLSGAFFEGRISVSPSTTLVSILRGEFKMLETVLWIAVSVSIYVIGRWMDERNI